MILWVFLDKFLLEMPHTSMQYLNLQFLQILFYFIASTILPVLFFYREELGKSFTLA